VKVGGARAGVRAEINVTPLVDVVLVLLIIFMVLTPLKLRELPVTVPRTATEVVAPDLFTEQLVVGYDARRQVRLGAQTLALDELRPRLRAALAARARKVVFLDIEADADYGGAVKVMDVCRGAGAETLGIMTPERP
jgi:biopolymer transport protein ExbD